MNKRIEAFTAQKVTPELVQVMKKLSHFLAHDASKNDLIGVIERIYNVADNYLETMITGHTSCVAGCSHCCKVDIEITLAEALYIQETTGRTLDRGEGQDRQTDCPFLAYDMCSIYQFRPLVCRFYGSLEDPAICEDPAAIHAIYSLKSSGDYWFMGVYRGMVENSVAVAERLGIESHKDIRDWFPEPQQE